MKEEKIKVLALLPMELPKEIELDNTLEAMQKFVGGLIECSITYYVFLLIVKHSHSLEEREPLFFIISAFFAPAFKYRLSCR